MSRAHPPIILNEAPELRPSLVAPFTHVLVTRSGEWSHTAHLELPDLDVAIYPAKTPGYSLLAVSSDGRSTVEVFDRNLSNFAGAISTAVKAHYPYNPKACHHLLQGVASALTFFGLHYGYLRMVGDDTIEATPYREDA